MVMVVTSADMTLIHTRYICIKRTSKYLEVFNYLSITHSLQYCNVLSDRFLDDRSTEREDNSAWEWVPVNTGEKMEREYPFEME